jgi:hypothetical protein
MIIFNENQLSIQLSQPTEFKIFTISDPQRIVVDLKNTKFSDNFEQKKSRQVILTGFLVKYFNY